jgi:hypothetical protein
MIALVKRRRNALAQAVPGDHAMPLGFRGPSVVRVLPRPLRGDGKNGERCVIRTRLASLRVLADETMKPMI